MMTSDASLCTSRFFVRTITHRTSDFFTLRLNAPIVDREAHNVVRNLDLTIRWRSIEKVSIVIGEEAYHTEV